jgi:hypothetical protein
MNPMFRAAVGSIVRRVLGYGSAFIVTWGVWTDAEAAIYVAGLAGVLLDVGWSFLEKYWQRQKLLTAQAMPGPSSEAQVEAVVKAGMAPPVNVPKTATPVLTQ